VLTENGIRPLSELEQAFNFAAQFRIAAASRIEETIAPPGSRLNAA
jgi:hypothetical protein